jgi:hypothetical protein
MSYLLKEKGPLTENEAKIYIAEIVLAVEHLQQVGTLSDYSPLQ